MEMNLYFNIIINYVAGEFLFVYESQIKKNS